jgi:hypothetical protein
MAPPRCAIARLGYVCQCRIPPRQREADLLERFHWLRNTTSCPCHVSRCPVEIERLNIRDACCVVAFPRHVIILPPSYICVQRRGAWHSPVASVAEFIHPAHPNERRRCLQRSPLRFRR